MRVVRTVCPCIWVIGLVLAACHAARADVSPGDVIDRTSWEKAQGLLPEPVLEWVKKGDFILNIDEPKFELADCFPPFQIQAFRTNAGKYELDDDGGIVEAKSGRPADHVVGLPFPKIADDDPRLAEKIMQNNHYMQYLVGNLRCSYHYLTLERSGFVQEAGLVAMQMPMVGYPGAVAIPNPQRMEKYGLSVLKTPFDVAGAAGMVWRYLDPNTQDVNFGYLPAIRRVRRVSAGNRSDSIWGSVLSADDGNGYDGKVTAFTWKLLRKQEAILPILDVNPVRIVRNQRGEWETTGSIKPVIYGYDKEGWPGAAWAPTNLCWIKRPVYVLEMKAKDRYYNYGTQYLWVEAQTYGCSYKVIHDRAGDYWKTLFISGAPCHSDDKSMRFLTLTSQQMIDDRTDQSGVIEDCSPRNIWVFFAEMDANDFSLAGFQKLCK
ncbi:MAG: DUF1329 domain-containing protein [bacterium]